MLSLAPLDVLNNLHAVFLPLGQSILDLGMWQKKKAEKSSKTIIHHIAPYLSAGAKREFGPLVHTCTLRDGWLQNNLHAMCLSTQMFIDVLLSSEQASCPLSRHATSASFSDPGTDLKAAPVAVLQSQVPIIMSLAYLRNNSNMFVGQVLPSGKGQKCIVACTCRSRTINSAKRIDSKHTHRNPESA
jgi:hypothetical protein